MRLSRWGLAVVAAMLLVPMVQADVTVIEVRIEEFHDISFFDAVYDTACADESSYAVMGNGRGFHWSEADPASSVPPLGSEPGYLATGCGTVTTSLPVPPDLQRVTVHFEASRTVETYDDRLQAEADLEQWFDLLDAQGRPVHGHHPVFLPRDAGKEMQPVGPLVFATTSSELGDTVDLQWGFRDDGVATQDQVPNPLSGQAFAASVQNVIVQFTRTVHVDGADVTSHQSRDGTMLTTEHRVRVMSGAFTESGAPALAVRIAPGNAFYGIMVPDGTLLRDVATLEDGLAGYGQTQATLQLTPSYMQVIFPRALVAAHGPGEYTFIFRDTDGVQVSPALVPLAGILLIAPLPFAVLAWMESRAFRREAFGRYAASARNLQWGVALVLAYYIVVVSSAAVGGRIPLMAVWPLELEGWLLHAQVLLAGVAFTGLWLVARELYLIVRPPRAETESL